MACNHHATGDFFAVGRRAPRRLSPILPRRAFASKLRGPSPPRLPEKVTAFFAAPCLRPLPNEPGGAWHGHPWRLFTAKRGHTELTRHGQSTARVRTWTAAYRPVRYGLHFPEPHQLPVRELGEETPDVHVPAGLSRLPLQPQPSRATPVAELVPHDLLPRSSPLPHATALGVAPPNRQRGVTDGRCYAAATVSPSGASLEPMTVSVRPTWHFTRVSPTFTTTLSPK